MDRNLRGVADAALDLAKPMPGERVLDIGCGSGETTLLLGEAVGPTGKVMGVDISHPLLVLVQTWRPSALIFIHWFPFPLDQPDGSSSDGEPNSDPLLGSFR